MIFQTRLQWLLAGSTVVFALAALLAAVVGNENGSTPTTTTSTVATTTTTTTAQPTSYTVQPGDSLMAIAEKFGVSFKELIQVNKITNPDKISVGDELKIPPPTIPPETTTTTSTTTTTVG